MMSLVYAQLAGLLKSDLATIEIELAVALRALNRGDADAATLALAEALRCARSGQQREPDSEATCDRLHHEPLPIATDQAG
jgi:hypothetical protein